MTDLLQAEPLILILALKYEEPQVVQVDIETDGELLFILQTVVNATELSDFTYILEENTAYISIANGQDYKAVVDALIVYVNSTGHVHMRDIIAKR